MDIPKEFKFFVRCFVQGSLDDGPIDEREWIADALGLVTGQRTETDR